MVRFVMKGGNWKNTEDEILKAAVMKYGKNQWARISSLLVRKTPKQCKARWYEWLDPSIKKTEWTREEEEKLLQLAKLKPCQWRTIAPMIGRTPAQCLEHFEKLMDAAQGIEAKDDPRKLRAGEIDPAPEMKPARPDPVDMDEDEKEMLSEARARLANTRGKKAKRKAREKQLEEARRLAFLQKKRELKAAGINVGKRRRRVGEGFDYLEEIPFEKRAPKGSFDVTGDRLRTVQLKNERTNFLGKTREELDGIRRDEIEERERKKDKKRLKLFKETHLPEAIEQISRLTDPERISRRSKLILPAPQMTDSELEAISKLGGVASAAASLAAADGSSGNNTATNTLLGNLQATPMATPMRTPLPKSSVMDEARKLAALTATQTPLLGGPSTPLPGDFEGVTPKHMGMSTPNVLASALRDGKATPSHYSVFGGTPQSTVSVIDEKEDRVVQKRKLLSGLMDLPAPQHEYSVEIPTLPSNSEKKDSEMVVDVEDEQFESRKRKLAFEQSEGRKRSLVVQQLLPQPKSFDFESTLFPLPPDVSGAVKESFRTMNDEMKRLVYSDMVNHPAKGREAAVADDKMALADLPERFITQARQMISAEVDQLAQEQPGAAETFNRVYDSIANDFVFVPGLSKFARMSTLSQGDRVSALQHQFYLIASRIEEENAKAKKLEAKIDILTFGYRKREQKLCDDVFDLDLDLEEAESNHDVYVMLAAQETNAVQMRLQNLKQEVAAVKEREASLQRMYASLLAEKQSASAK